MSMAKNDLIHKGDLRIFQFQNFPAGLVQAVFSRHGGVSPEPWASLNLGSTVGDDLERVRENKRRILEAMGRAANSLFEVWQVHGVEVAIADAPLPPQVRPDQADAILTDKPGITLLMRFADCVPILLHDPQRKVAGIVHAGWLGTVLGTVRHAVQAMQAHYGCQPGDIRAGIGPSIGPDHYEVGMDVIDRVKAAFGQDADGLIRRENGRHFLDLWSANRLLLENAGVRQIEVAGICTACSIVDWYSHRAENGRTGRFGAMIALGE